MRDRVRERRADAGARARRPRRCAVQTPSTAPSMTMAHVAALPLAMRAGTPA
jgi:hypothetical protein